MKWFLWTSLSIAFLTITLGACLGHYVPAFAGAGWMIFVYMVNVINEIKKRFCCNRTA